MFVFGANLGLFLIPNTAKAQSVEVELIDSHREEVSQLKKLVAAKEEDLHKTVQKYEQVLQVSVKEKSRFIFRSWKKQNESHPHLEAISVGSCP